MPILSDKIRDLINNAKTIVILQADNPDGDSLGSALALEHILGDLGKDPHLYCGVDIPTYLRHLSGWDRVSKDLPKSFDMSIVVDASAISLFDSTDKQQRGVLRSKPSLIIDHHPLTSSEMVSDLEIRTSAVATAETIYEIAKEEKWPLSLDALKVIATGIMSDSLGLTSEATSARSIHIVAELVDAGVKLAELENNRRLLMRKSPELTKYKGELLQRIQLFDEGRIATITIPWDEIQTYSPLYNPSMLVIEDMRLIEGADVAIAFKHYKDGRVTAKIRCNYGHAIAKDLAEHFGGGGHPYASGFKVTDGRSLQEITKETIQKASELLDVLT